MVDVSKVMLDLLLKILFLQFDRFSLTLAHAFLSLCTYVTTSPLRTIGFFRFFYDCYMQLTDGH
jgi:hypothetical protein